MKISVGDTFTKNYNTWTLEHVESGISCAFFLRSSISGKQIILGPYMMKLWKNRYLHKKGK